LLSDYIIPLNRIQNSDMAKIEVYLPAMGEGVIEATINKWLLPEGAKVEEDDPLVEVATDKVDSEVPSPAAGILL
jgi:2-oxoglutarate dehydrogenase E2 component (dihydrolipoamide succinyltransferase)